MIASLEGVVIKSFRYGETSKIAHVYTREKGMQSIMIKGALSAKNNKASMLQPMTHIGLVVYQKNQEQSLLLLKEIQINTVYHAIGVDFTKNAIALFCSELLYKTLKEQASNEALFDFVVTSMRQLDMAKTNVANHHLYFISELSNYLGIGIASSSLNFPYYFDYIESEFTLTLPLHGDFLKPDQATLLNKMLVENENPQGFQPTNAERRTLLEMMIIYYRHHVNDFGKLHSWDVLQVLFTN